MCVLLLIIASASPAMETPADRLQAANAQLRDAWLAEDAAALQGTYAADAMLMPEHSVARRGTEAIGEYYRRLFAGIELEAYHRAPRETLVFGDHAVETGHYRQAFHREGTPRTELVGKYMALWDMRGAEPKLVSELWGADAPFDRAVLPEIPGPVDPPSSAFGNDPALLAEVTSRNALIDTLVTERRGAEHAALFLPDAIYLTYYTPMRVGAEQIREYFVEHEKPGGVAIDALDLRSGHLHALQRDDVLLEEGFYQVDWRAGEDHGTVQGKSLNLWKRDADGQLKLYRQAVNHD
ncbi:MAG TPA: nuclear transport factor 2 family protein [Stenotrophomonas sp.]